jgi:hypothetical protein
MWYAKILNGSDISVDKLKLSDLQFENGIHTRKCWHRPQRYGIVNDAQLDFLFFIMITII